MTGHIRPDDFFRVAATASLIIDVDCWVLRAPPRQLVAWSADPARRGRGRPGHPHERG